MWQAIGDTQSRLKGGWVDYRNGKQFKTALWGKKQGELFENSQGKHGIGPYSSHEMLFVSIEREVRGVLRVSRVQRDRGVARRGMAWRGEAWRGVA